MKKTIASLAFLASASTAFGLIGPGGPGQAQPKNVCLSLSHSPTGGSFVGDCDLTEQNRRAHARLLANGCAVHQASLRSFRVKVHACPTFAQL